MNASYNAIRDEFTLDCFGRPYPVVFQFYLTEMKGFFNGTVEGFPRRQYPDTIVATGGITKEGYTKKEQYEWVIEFQCNTQKLGDQQFIKFVGINFYCAFNHPPKSMLDEMVNEAYKRGLGVYLDEKIVYEPQANCTYPWDK